MDLNVFNKEEEDENMGVTFEQDEQVHDLQEQLREVKAVGENLDKLSIKYPDELVARIRDLENKLSQTAPPPRSSPTLTTPRSRLPCTASCVRHRRRSSRK